MDELSAIISKACTELTMNLLRQNASSSDLPHYVERLLKRFFLKEMPSHSGIVYVRLWCWKRQCFGIWRFKLFTLSWKCLSPSIACIVTTSGYNPKTEEMAEGTHPKTLLLDLHRLVASYYADDPPSSIFHPSFGIQFL